MIALSPVTLIGSYAGVTITGGARVLAGGAPPARPAPSPTLVGPAVRPLVMSFAPSFFDTSDEDFPGGPHLVESVGFLVTTRCARAVPIGRVSLSTETRVLCEDCKHGRTRRDG